MGDDEGALQYLGAPEEVVRATEARYADQARTDFATYLRDTLHYNQRSGGRYNAPGEFGLLYTASDEATAWAELHARFLREGLPGLPRTMGLLRLVLHRGQFADFNEPRTCEAWGVDVATLTADVPTAVQQDTCWRLGRDLRAVADFLKAPSARATGDNVPLFVRGRADADFAFDLSSAEPHRPTPVPPRQVSHEAWD